MHLVRTHFCPLARSSRFSKSAAVLMSRKEPAMARESMLTPDMIADFQSRGGAVSRLDVGVTVGLRNRDWKRLVRGNPEEVVSDITPYERRQLKLHAGYGAR